MGNMKSLRESHTEATIDALLSAGRRQFGSRGYDAVSLEEIGAEARVTTGAVYHHFKGKKGLFLGVAEAVERDLLSESVLSADRGMCCSGCSTDRVFGCAAGDWARSLAGD